MLAEDECPVCKRFKVKSNNYCCLDCYKKDNKRKV